MLGISFGKFRIVHTGHLRMIDQMLRENDEVIIGISNRSRDLRSLNVIKALRPNVEVRYTKTPFTLMEELEVRSRPNFYAGTDRSSMLARLSEYYNIEHRCVLRTHDDVSSSLIRSFDRRYELTPLLLFNMGFAEDIFHAHLILAQLELEKL